MPLKRKRCTIPGLFCAACKFLESIGGLGYGDSCKRIRQDARKAGKDIWCKGHRTGVLLQITEESMQRPVRTRKRVQGRTGSGHSLSASGNKSNFCTGAFKENKRQKKYRSRVKRGDVVKRKELARVSKKRGDTKRGDAFWIFLQGV